MSKMTKEDKRFLRKAGFRAEHGALCDLACAIKAAHETKRDEGYVVRPDSNWGKRTRRRILRKRMRAAAMRFALYAGSAAAVILTAGLIWFFSV